MKTLWPYYDDLPTCSDKYISKIFTFKFFRTIETSGRGRLLDVESEYYNVINSMRHTTDNPNTYDNTIHFFGNCIAAGAFAEDKYTIGSQLQRIINSSPLHNKTFNVANHSGIGVNSLLGLEHIEHTVFSGGDIIILISGNSCFKYYLNSKAVRFFCFDSAFNRPHGYGEIFFDCYHMNHRGYKLIANKIYSILSGFLNDQDAPIDGEEKTRNQCRQLKDFVPQKHSVNDSTKTQQTINPLLNDYLAYLQNEKTNCEGVIGSIVMNCNPFTLGHRFLIEEAARQCDFLYIFVVEEDKSFFSFADRLILVNAGTGDLENVKVLKGGSFIISSMTLPEYFVKETQKDLIINASKDLAIFAESIAPALNISKRFVGEEPLDPITGQYNRAMLDTLPRSGIEVIEIPRKLQLDGTPISASLVRQFLKDNNFEAISKIVPKTTLDYLKNSHA
jgi:[citrate (pro-3S)-lyase] ligase